MIESLNLLAAKRERMVAGLISGTSMDGVDVVICKLSGSGIKTVWDLLYFNSYPYSNNIRKKVIDTLIGTAEDVCRLNFDLGKEFSYRLKRAFEESGIDVGQLDLIGSHGQTIYHVNGQSSLQVAEASVIAEDFGVPVISDFRVRDIAAGGNGAPLVPYLDYVLFGKDGGKLLLNLGGIANFTIIPSAGADLDNIRAWDTGPANMLIDLATMHLTEGKEKFDESGKYAAEGKINENWMKNLMAHPFVTKSPPKSTGREDFGEEYFQSLLSAFKVNTKQDKLDLIATVTRFTAESVYSNFKSFSNSGDDILEVIMSGGGADNPVIKGHLEELFSGISIKQIDDYGILSDAKEAFAFAVLANEFISGTPTNIPSVTGADKRVLLGKLTV